MVQHRYAARRRDARHLDNQRSQAELWGQPVAPLGVGPLITVDTATCVDLHALARQIRGHLTESNLT
ncbi:MAG: hypothetical protein QM708_00580 [Propioniciclava sp.]|uniref:hypothetical protein n=1 Tax=Propioniciclava sp. TaxID=2038686 RepID=UPI0039E44D80